MRKKCDNCKFSGAEYYMGYISTCKRYPPQFITREENEIEEEPFDPYELTTDYTLSRFPMTSEEECCGEWKFNWRVLFRK